MNDQPVIFVVDDDDQARKAVMALVEAMGVETCGYASAEEFLAAYDGRRPACLVTDVRMLGMSGLELQEELLRRGASIPVDRAHRRSPAPPGTVRAMKNGAVTLLEKPCRDDELWEAVRDGLAADRQALAAEQSREDVRRRLATLTAKEREVLALHHGRRRQQGRRPQAGRAACGRSNCTATASSRRWAPTRWPNSCGWSSPSRTKCLNRPC